LENLIDDIKKTEVSTQHPYSFKEGFLKIDPSFSPHGKTTFSWNNLKFLLLDFSSSNNLHSIEDIIKLIELESRSSIASYPPALTQHINTEDIVTVKLNPNTALIIFNILFFCF
jgi:hypothetical protein